MTSFSLEHRIVRGEGHVETHVDGQTLMMSLERGRYFALERTGQRIWSLIDRPVAVSDIVETLMSEYDVGRQECEAQVLAFIEDLASNGLVRRAPA